MTSVLPGPKATLTVEIRGRDLPGRSCDPAPGGRPYENIHVGLKTKKGIIDLVPGDAPAAQWEFDVVLRNTDDGFDYGGPVVLGPRGERHLGLCWVTVANDGSLEVFRGAKLRFSDVDPAVMNKAVRTGGRVVVSLGLTDEQGYPRCASVRPPLVEWSVA